MTISFPSVEFDHAVAAVCHGTSTEEEMRALNELLRGSAAARDEYLLRVEVHTRLASEPALFPQPEEAGFAATVSEMVLNRGRTAVFPKLRPGNSKRRLAQVLTFAACLVLAVAGTWSWWSWRAAGRNEATSRAVAMLTRVVDPRWNHGSGPRVGSALEPGTLRLESGLAQVVFYSGARVVIEGPAELQLVSSTEAVCPAGKLLAEVPEPAHGFHLKTSQLDVVDLGTAFGIDVIRGRTELHVFKGEVEFSADKGAKQSLTEGQAAVVQGKSPPQLTKASAEAFTSLFELQQRSLTAEAFRYDEWRVANALLNQDPSLLVHLDLLDLSESDWTLHNAVEKDGTMREATIIGCERAEGRWPEKQALAFRSVNDRVRLVVPGEFNSLTLAAWVRIGGLDRQFNSLFMCDGFESGTIHWLLRNDGVLSLAIKGPGGTNPEIAASPSVLKPENFGVWTHVAVVLDGGKKQVVHYLNGIPASRHSLGQVPPFRIGSAELGNWNPKNEPRSDRFRIQNLGGTMDEFEMFSRALSDAEVRALFAGGKPQPGS